MSGIEALADVQRIIGLLATDPLGAADAIENVSARLREQAEAIRKVVSAEQSPFKVPGGMVDIVKMRVVGPNGEIKQSVTTE